MPQRVSLSISLTSEMAAYVASKVESGRYESVSEAVRMGLRLLEAKEPIPTPQPEKIKA